MDGLYSEKMFASVAYDVIRRSIENNELYSVTIRKIKTIMEFYDFLFKDKI